MHTSKASFNLSRAASLLAVTLALLAPASAVRAEVMNFDPGSLIIPMQANYQSACGTVSSYGLIWRILQANQTGHYNGSHPVTVYWVIGNKQSINRCSPSNLHDASLPSSSPNLSGTNWNDGCDVMVPDSSVATGSTSPQPVTMVDYTTTFPSSGLYPKTAVWNVSTLSRTVSGYAYATPAYGAVTLTEANHLNRVRYLGGPFVISAADAPNVINFLKTGDAYVSATELAKFITPSTSCDTSNVPSTTTHYVRMHQALTGFSANVSRKMNAVPPRIALVNLGSGVSTGILDHYLKNAGLDEPTGCTTTHTCYGGCPTGSASSCTANGSTTSTKYPGLLYDNLDGNLDIHSTAQDHFGVINRRDAKHRLIYQVLWAPHWTLSANTGSGASLYTPISEDPVGTTEMQSVLNNIGRFTDVANTGIMSECASIGSYEGGDSTVSWATLGTSSFAGTSNARFLSTNGWRINKLSSSYWNGRNCTDPNYSSGACFKYPYPSDPFSQLGDFTFFMVSGLVQDFVPQTGTAPASTYTAQNRLAVSALNYPGGPVTGDLLLPSSDSDQNRRTLFSYGQKQNRSDKATVLYLGGHDFSGVAVPGNRVVLNTLMNMGFNPVANERSFTQPIGYVDPNGSDSDGSKEIVVGSSFDAVTGYPTSPAIRSFTKGQQSQWVFPFYPGHLRAHSLVGGSVLGLGENDYTSGLLWDTSSTDVMTLPKDRNVFTYLGGKVTPSPSYTSYGSDNSTTATTTAPNNILQTGWSPQMIGSSYINLDLTFGSTANPNCVDKMKLSTFSDGGVTYTFGSNGICDLEEAIQFTAPTVNSSTKTIDTTTTWTSFQTDLNPLKQMLQKILGYCVASSTLSDISGTPNFTPGDNDCNNPGDDNRAMLGGLVHSTPAIVPASAYRSEKRPTVAYVGGWDGQLHAIYVSGGQTFTGGLSPAAHFPNPSPVSKFPNKWTANGSCIASSSGTCIAPGGELWSYLPASQLPWLKTNNARVDSSPVFHEFNISLVGTGALEWHTIVVTSVGGDQGRGLFALDVTDPLKPVLLWDLTGTLYTSGSYPTYSPVELANQTRSGVDDLVYRWIENTSTFSNPVDTSHDPGVSKTGLYDYSELGGSTVMAMGQTTDDKGLLVVTSSSYAKNSSGSQVNGIIVYGIDVATGQKRWEWRKDYASAFPYNNPPPSPTLSGTSGKVDTVWVADLEGYVWELDALTGRNKNVITWGLTCTATSPCAVPAFLTGSTTTAPRPVSTNLAIAKLPTSATGALQTWAGKNVLLFGTNGYDWTYAVNPTGEGMVHGLIVDSAWKVKPGAQKVTTGTFGTGEAEAYVLANGVYQEPAPFPVTLGDGEAVYGSITIAGSDAFFVTSNGPMGNDPMAVDTTITGKTRQMHLGTLPNTTNPYVDLGLKHGNWGGVTVVHYDHGSSSTDFIVTQESTTIGNIRIDNAGAKGSASPDSSLNPFWSAGSAGFFSWMTRIWSHP